MKLDKKNGNIECVTMINIEKYHNYFSGAILKHNNRIIIAPYLGNQFWIYDIDSGKQKIIFALCDKPLITNIYILNDKAYFTGYLPEIFVINFSNDMLEVIPFIDVTDQKFDEKNIWSRGECCFWEKNIIIPNIHDNIFIFFNIETHTYIKKIIVGLPDNGVNNICFVDGDFWVLPRCGNGIFKHNLKSGETEVINCNVEIDSNCHLLNNEKQMIMADYRSARVYAINRSTLEISELMYDTQNEYVNDNSDMRIIRLINAESDCIYINSLFYDELLKFSFVDNQVERVAFIIKDPNTCFKMIADSKNIVQECWPLVSLSQFIDWCNKENSNYDFSFNVGKNIHMLLLE